MPVAWPATSDQVLKFAAVASLENKAYGTVRTYMAAIGTKHKLNGWQDPTDNFLVQKLMQGLARDRKQADCRLPITMEKLEKLVAVLDHICASSYEAKLFKAAFTLAFFGFLRVSEIVGQGATSPRCRVGLSTQDISFTSEMSVTINGSKTDQRNYGTVVPIKPLWDKLEVCPVNAMRRYMNVRPTGHNTLFVHFDGKPLTKFQFQAVLKKAAVVLHWDATRFSSHSFRIGAATTAASNGVALSLIMRMGRWRSQAVTAYIRPSQTALK